MDSYNIAGIYLTLQPPGDRRKESELKGAVTLSAAPKSAQEIELLPGQWVDLKLRTAVECSSEEFCHGFAAEPHAQLVAHWLEALYTFKRVPQCGIERGEYDSRMLDSDPLEVVLSLAPSN
jgi:hypothetical protein